MMFGEFDIPNEHIIIKTKYCFVFTNLRPFLKYHILVSPIAKKQFLVELSEDEYVDLFLTVKLCLKSLSNFGTSFTVSIQDGAEAGQSVPHVHVHIVPRNKNDIENNDLIYAKGALDIKRNDRSFEEMKKETYMLRKEFKKYFNVIQNESLL
ncbi:diadenosine tetraphosphate hydrolase [Vairimorpha apis BRL 01]|uniref:Bis(5'-adenosyl)-triphosphatase n=1 Tax=Vairimorpha apis BRL 01 TaxID=1037528 RepID=T0M9Z2_9MICR|nr:diadenosine tetraphosphate hydrolase [Vairimorpha apis BRL 01]